MVDSSTLAELLPVILPVLGGVYGVFKGVTFVREGERAIRLRFERAVRSVKTKQYVVIRPGFTLMIPSVHKLARIHVRERTINFDPQTIVLADMTIFDVSAVLLCEVIDTPDDLYKALFETSDLNASLANYGLTVIRDVLSSKAHTNLVGDDWRSIAPELLEKMQNKASEWGVRVIQFELSDCRPDQGTAQLILTSSQTAFRFAALQDVAEQMGYRDVTQLGASFAAVLVGHTVVAGPPEPLPGGPRAVEET